MKVEALPLRIGVVADTHSSPHPKAMEHLAERAPDLILHAGDIGDHAVLAPLEELAPTIAVRGNIDERVLPDSYDLAFERDGATLTMLLTHIAVRGPRLRKDASELADRHRAELVVCGHSHVPLIARDRGKVVFNPGSIGPRRFHLPITFGMIELTDEGLSMHHVDAVSGARWSP